MSNRTAMISPKEFSDDVFLRKNAFFVDEYVQLRRRNVPAKQAMTRVFGSNQDDERIGERIRRLEGTSVYCESLERALHGPAGAKAGWNASQAVWDLREMVNDPTVSAQARNTALKELNVLYGLTITDPAGNTRSGHGLEDFYKREGKLSANAPGTKNNPHKLPDDLQATPEAPEQYPPAEAMPKREPDPIPPAHASLIGDALQPVQPRPVAQTRQIVPFEGLRAVKG